MKRDAQIVHFAVELVRVLDVVPSSHPLRVQRIHGTSATHARAVDAADAVWLAWLQLALGEDDGTILSRDHDVPGGGIETRIFRAKDHFAEEDRAIRVRVVTRAGHDLVGGV